MRRCHANATIFPANCTANSTQIEGVLMIDDWNLDFIPFYMNYWVISGIILVMHYAAYITLRLMPTYRAII